jgi:hypothetical protein
MSALAGIFQKGGYHYRTIPDVIALLPKGMQHAADVAMKCVLWLKARGKLDETATDKELANVSEQMAREAAEEKGVDYQGDRGWSPSLMQKGLHAVDVELRKIGVPPLVQRKSGIGMRGRRQITVMPLAGKEKGEKAADDPPAAGPPPAPPPEKEKTGETTTTDGGSSSSLASLPGTGPEWPPELLDAIGLVPGLSAARLGGWVQLAGIELAIRVVAWLRIWLAHPNPDKRPKGAFWAERALSNWRAKLEAGLLTMEDVDQEIEAKRRKWGPKSAPKDNAAEKARREAERAEEQAQAARDKRLREAWGVLRPDEQAEILAGVLEARPEIRRFKPESPFVMAPCLEELERRQAEAHPRE